MSLAALCLAFAAASVVAEPLDVRVVPVTEGTVQAVRDIHVNPNSVTAQGSTPRPVGVPSGVEEGPPVGAVAARPIGVPKSERSWRFGAAQSAEMEDRFAQGGYEVVVTMDDGEQRAFRMRDASRFHPGQRVSVRAGEVEPLEK